MMWSPIIDNERYDQLFSIKFTFVGTFFSGGNLLIPVLPIVLIFVADPSNFHNSLTDIYVSIILSVESGNWAKSEGAF